MILLTGGAGFIGSNILAALNAAGRTDVIVVDDLTDGTKCANLSGKEFADYIDGGDLERVLSGLPKLDGVCHQAACVDTTARDGRAVMRANYDMSKRLLGLARDQGCPFVYASSAATYGDGSGGFREEKACERAKTPYAFSKWQFDQYVRRNIDEFRVPVVGLRYFNVYGPGEAHKARMASVAWHSFVAIGKGDAPRMFEGSENFLRDFIYVGDVADVNLFFLLGAGCDCSKSGIYNLGTGEPRSFADLVTLASQVTSGPPPVTIPFPDDLRGQYQAYTCADISRLRAAGWDKPFTSLEDGMAAYWRAIRP
jgi:ADP-L-glycero-D-manno-heptose 6-epimerase